MFKNVFTCELATWYKRLCLSVHWSVILESTSDAGGRAGACNPHPHPRLPHTHSNTDNHNCYIKNARFDTNQRDHHGPTDWRTNRTMDKTSCTVVCPQLKRVKIGNSAFPLPLILLPIAYLPICRDPALLVIIRATIHTNN